MLGASGYQGRLGHLGKLRASGYLGRLGHLGDLGNIGEPEYLGTLGYLERLEKTENKKMFYKTHLACKPILDKIKAQNG